MAEIALTPNSRRVVWSTVRWADGNRIPVILDPGEGWFDEDGYLRFFSLQFPDGSVGNYKLLPQDQGTDIVLRVARNFLLPFGLTVASNLIFAGDAIVHNVAGELFERFGEIVVGDYLDGVRMGNAAYYNIAQGWCVIEEPLRA